MRLRALRSGDDVRFEVSDDGPGIPPEHRLRVFEKFFRLPGRAPGGAGLGLSIARGDRRARTAARSASRSEPARGARFWFTLPRATRGAAPAAQRP